MFGICLLVGRFGILLPVFAHTRWRRQRSRCARGGGAANKAADAVRTARLRKVSRNAIRPASSSAERCRIGQNAFVVAKMVSYSPFLSIKFARRPRVLPGLRPFSIEAMHGADQDTSVSARSLPQASITWPTATTSFLLAAHMTSLWRQARRGCGKNSGLGKHLERI